MIFIAYKYSRRCMLAFSHCATEENYDLLRKIAHKSRESVNREHGRQARLQVVPLSMSPSCVM